MSCSSSRHFVDCSEKKLSSEGFYNALYNICEEWTTNEHDLIACTANISSIIYQSYISYKGANCVNWVGFYFVKPKLSNRTESELVLGPFQGKAAVVRIDFKNGVCGAAVRENKTQLVKDVHSFPGHIACDSNSNSEIVIPIRKTDIVAVLDMDSPTLNFFTEEDQAGLERICQLLENNVNWMSLRCESSIINY